MEAVATGLLAALNTYAEAIGAAGVELPRVGAWVRSWAMRPILHRGLSAYACQLWPGAATRGW